MASSPAQTTCLTPQHPDGWHFPFGPSSKYHASQRTRPAHHTRYKSSYTPTAPVLSTELRAHRRTRSNITVATVSTPTPREHAVKSPLALMSSTGPHTPERRRRKSVEPHGSPFSDYFTDENRSIATSSFQTPSAATQQLLVRLSRLQARLMREHTPILFQIVERKMDEIDVEVKAVEEGDHMRDSGLFIEEEDLDRTEIPNERAVESVASDAEVDDNVEDEIDPNICLAEARQVLETVTQAQQELRQRLQEMSDLRLAIEGEDQEEDAEEGEEPEDEDIHVRDETELAESSELPEDACDDLAEEDGRILSEAIEDSDATLDRPKSSHSSPELDNIKSAWQELWEGLYDLAGMSSLDP